MTRLNGKEVQRSGTDLLIYSIPHIVAFCSDFTTLAPGDVIATGTPEGVGHRRNPPLWMKAGDVLEVEITGIGTLRTRIVDEKASTMPRSPDQRPRRGILRRAARTGTSRRALPCAHDPAEALAKCADADILIIRTDEIFAELVDAHAEASPDPGADHRHRPHPGAAEPAASTCMLAAARGFHGAQMSELAFIFMLHFMRDFRDLFATQDAHALEPGRAEPPGATAPP